MKGQKTKNRRTSEEDDDDYEEIHGHPRPERIGGDSVEWVKIRAQIGHFIPGIGDPFELTIEEFFQMAGQMPDILRLVSPSVAIE